MVVCFVIAGIFWNQFLPLCGGIVIILQLVSRLKRQAHGIKQHWKSILSHLMSF